MGLTLHMPLWLAVFGLLLLLPLCTADAQSGQVTNVHDPCIITCGDYHYVFSTGDGIAIRRSRDLQRWHYLGEVFDDINARELTTLVEETLLHGHYNMPFDASDFPPGVYLYSIQTNAFVETKKMVVLP